MRKFTDVKMWENVTQAEWDDWKWQIKNRIDTVERLKEVVNLTETEEEGIRESLKQLKMGITPYYALLMDKDDPNCPVRKQAVPTILETHIAKSDMLDPLHEDADSPVAGLTHRYPDRVLGQNDQQAPTDQIDKCIEYIENTPVVRDVLLSGGDALLISDERLEYILKRLTAIEHVEVVRIGSRVPVVMPQRITPALVEMLKKYHPVWLNTHFNHSKEITPESTKACELLANAGVPLGNQSVLLRGINDNVFLHLL